MKRCSHQERGGDHRGHFQPTVGNTALAGRRQRVGRGFNSFPMSCLCVKAKGQRPLHKACIFCERNHGTVSFYLLFLQNTPRTHKQFVEGEK